MDVAKQCMTEWKRIQELTTKSTQRSTDEDEELAVLKHKFNLVVSADYQMCKLVSYWGLSPQPGSTYYLQKFNHYVFGIVNHATTKGPSPLAK